MAHSYRFLVLLFSFVVLWQQGMAQAQPASRGTHPSLVLTKQGVQQIRQSLGRYPLLDSSYEELKKEADKALKAKLDVPFPRDAGGGRTHRQHQKNYKAMYAAGMVYQITKDERYARYVKDMLLAYAKIYTILPLHPAATSKTPGKLFWQSLNDCVWLVHTIQAYDCVYDWLGKDDITTLNKALFYPMAEFLSEGSAYSFNRIHNHGTWAVAAVGMTGYVTGKQELVEQALRGLAKDGKGGFLAQLDQLFSPDGYYTEGPYYQRYAMMPFVLFAKAIGHRQPALNIFAYRDSVLVKAVQATLQLTYKNTFFPLNDAIKGEDLTTDEMVYAVDLVYGYAKNPELLSIAETQGRVILTAEGVEIAAAISKGLAAPFRWHSVVLRDGAQGTEGGIGILRSGGGQDHTCAVMKYSAHGLSHGHYDKLSLLLYDQGQEVLQDYGAVRFVNNPDKDGGRYLPENKTWAQQTVAHNTLVVDGQSHFGGDIRLSERMAPRTLYFDSKTPEVQLTAAIAEGAYPGVTMKRYVAMIQDSVLEHPVVVDVFDVASESSHQYDLPYYYLGDITATTFERKALGTSPLGKANGYEHLQLTAIAKPGNQPAQVTWQHNGLFYTLTTASTAATEILFTRIGAQDPDDNLRKEPGLLLRIPEARQHTFVSVIEPHGKHTPGTKATGQTASQLKGVSLVGKSTTGMALEIAFASGEQKILLLATGPNQESPCQLTLDGKNVRWSGTHWYGPRAALKQNL
ncbi:heparinase II/III family protein [Pontibacter sp. E15-1]|uniref:alginate lyase family protein n=1 Tax=Pontibacter sp. E15-1 TaxID=2919918 RepID=UPI001F4F1F66|nr:alginate lyase family protein [Pontibacter sp. E15-1]MCJ8163229.1 heparinase II/III family protein [Pontibacter sp. E15-1]